MSGLAGSLRERVTIERRDDLPREAGGGASGGWTAIATRWAAIAPAGSGEAEQAGARSALPRFRVTLRAGADVAIGDRLVWGDRRLRVVAEIVDPRTPDRIEFTAEEER